ncbi:MAG TPA: TRIC cation channel family protein [Blastocatellia bacterium]
MNLPSFPHVDLFSAGINALNGILVARHPSHDRRYTVAGLLIMAFFGGIGGGVARDVLLNDIPAPIKDPNYFVACLLMGLLGLAIYRYAESKEEQFRTRTLAFFKSFTLPWFAILGAHKALDHDLGFFAAILIGLLATTAGGVLIDLFSGVTPEVVRPSEHVVTTAVLASTVYTLIALLWNGRQHFFPVTLISVLIAFVFRLLAVREHWSQMTPMDAPTAGPANVAAGRRSSA